MQTKTEARWFPHAVYSMVSALLWAILATAPATSQESGQPPEEPTRPEVVQEEIEVNLVRLPILAKGRNNEPITDLAKDDLRVVHRGEDLEIAYLESFRQEPDEEPLPTVRLHVDLPDAPEEVVTSGDVPPRHIVFYIDVENDQKLHKPQAAGQLSRFVMQDLEPGYRAAVLSFNGEVNVEQGFTGNGRRVVDAIRRAFDRAPRPQLTLQARIRQLVDQFEECITSRGAFVNDANSECVRGLAFQHAAELNLYARDYMDGLEGLVRYVSGLEGRKSVVAVSHGVASNPGIEIIEALEAVMGQSDQIPFLEMDLRSGEGVRSKRNEIIELALEHEVTLHFVDRNLLPPGDSGARRRHAYQPGARPLQVAFEAAQMELQEIAEHTGGVFVASPMDLYEGVREVMGLEQGGYYLGFYTDRRLPLDEIGKIRVKTSRKGVRILHRTGVYTRSRVEQLTRDIGGRIALGRPKKTHTGESFALRVPFRLVAEPRDIGYETSDVAAHTHFTLHMLVEDGNGRRLTDSYHFVNHSYPLELWESKEIEPVTIAGWVEVPPGEYRLAAVIRNPRLGKEGEIALPLTVRPGSAPEGDAAAEPEPSDD